MRLHDSIYAVSAEQMSAFEADGLIVEDVLQADCARNLVQNMFLLVHGSCVSSGFLLKLIDQSRTF